MEFADGGDLSTYITDALHNDYATIKAILAQMIAGLSELHRRSIYHGDLKLENVLLRTNPDGHSVSVKLADFGLSGSVNDNNNNNESKKPSRGTPEYMAPEQLLAQGQGQKGLASDCWSLGVCAWELATGLPPFYSPDPIEILNATARAEWKRDLEERAPGPVEYKGLLRGLLQSDPSKRLSIEGKSGLLILMIKYELSRLEVKRHPFFADINWKRPPAIPSTLRADSASFSIRNERFSSFKPYNLQVLTTERVINAQEHLQDANSNGMFPDESLYAAASELFPICNLYVDQGGE